MLTKSFMWCLMVIFVSTSSVFLAITVSTQAGDTPKLKAGLYSLLSQVVLQLLSNMCHLIPVFHDATSRTGAKKKLPRINFYVFCSAVVVSIATVTAAPFAYLDVRLKPAVDMSNVLNFVSNVSGLVTAAQIGSAIMATEKGPAHDCKECCCSDDGSWGNLG